MAVVGSGLLGPGGTQHLDVVLRGGITYNIYVNPSEAGVDFDLYIYDEINNTVAYDNTPASSAMCLYHSSVDWAIPNCDKIAKRP